MADKGSFLQDSDVKDFTRDIQQYNLGPLWEAIPEVMNKTPQSHAQAYLWSGELLKKKLSEAAEIFTPDRGGERRAIYFQNPGLTYRQPWGHVSTTQTLYAAVQLLQPGEEAPSHRHTQSALRFITDGEGAYTIVQGERIFMEEGDFLTTPKNLWHGHGHLGDEPMIWMDALDIPTIYNLGGTFFEPYEDGLQQPDVPDNFSEKRYQGGMVRPIGDDKFDVAPLANYKWDRTVDAINGLMNFEPDPYDGFTVEYINPSTGKSANPTVGSRMTHLPKGHHTKAHRHTHSVIYCVHRGAGYTVINGTKFNWKKGDYFVVPNWNWHEHVASEDSYLFSVNDIPIMNRFELERGDSLEENKGHQKIIDEFTGDFR
ncbi:MAG: cupin domain-containing protein [Staphylococcus equorum]|uniref:Cupin domain-containing protein n=1 Tax=Staphylococcus equorum TaxID=246432 RepID=A0AAW7AG80_9STAP|nr:cupin domain-containing protein [Staphylococcus equorum]MDK9842686.1 cupin domain-containing protein [Staphylococcus equorum]MDK9852086.1 cupin domain-containing protein [Staphylococcus equorum]MDK9864670.1 cupin domain-containing protein [Staphylococcus equorum]MDN5603046.1 cupin domain-containing protein [Staphylococcus equorum]MDN5613728.1 cupin domain-containing protein [Staphylococcus equorum]